MMIETTAPPVPRTFDRRLYAITAVAFSLIVLAGFSPTYYLKALFGTPPLATGLVHVHGALMTTWVALFATQVWLVSAKQIRVHQRLGYAAIGLAALIIVTGLPVAVHAAKYGTGAKPDAFTPLQFLVVPVTDLVEFALLFAAAVYFRRRPREHKSLMFLTVVNFLPPALGRIPPRTAAVAIAIPIAATLLALGLDTWRQGRVNRVFLVASILVIAALPGRILIMKTPAWMAIATWLTNLAG